MSDISILSEQGEIMKSNKCTMFTRQNTTREHILHFYSFERRSIVSRGETRARHVQLHAILCKHVLWNMSHSLTVSGDTLISYSRFYSLYKQSTKYNELKEINTSFRDSEVT